MELYLPFRLCIDRRKNAVVSSRQLLVMLIWIWLVISRHLSISIHYISYTCNSLIIVFTHLLSARVATQLFARYSFFSFNHMCVCLMQSSRLVILIVPFETLLLNQFCRLHLLEFLHITLYNVNYSFSIQRRNTLITLSFIY